MASCCTCDRPLLRLDLDPFAPDERLASVERNLALLIESRFGPWHVYEPIAKPRTRRPETMLWFGERSSLPPTAVGRKTVRRSSIWQVSPFEERQDLGMEPTLEDSVFIPP